MDSAILEQIKEFGETIDSLDTRLKTFEGDGSFNPEFFEKQLKERDEKFELLSKAFDQLKNDKAEVKYPLNPGLYGRKAFERAARGVGPNLLPQWDTGMRERFLDWFRERVISPDRTKAAMEGGTDSLGGELVPDEFVATLIDIQDAFGVFRQNATVVPMAGDSQTWPSLTGNVAVAWVAEGVASAEVAPTFGNVQLNTSTLRALVPISNELLQDSKLGIVDLLVSNTAVAFAEEEDQQGFNGDTSGTDPFDGVINSMAAGQTYILGQATPDASLTTTGSTAFTDITYNDLIFALQNLSTKFHNARTAWYMHKTILYEIRRLVDTTGQPLVQPDIGEPNRLRLLGYPIVETEKLPNVSASAITTDFFVVGDLAQMYLGDRLSRGFALSEHAGFSTYQTLFRVVERIAIKVALDTSMVIIRTSTT